MNLNMLAAMHGRERTADEYAQLLAAAGFDQAGVKVLAGPRDIVYARKM